MKNKLKYNNQVRVKITLADKYLNSLDKNIMCIVLFFVENILLCMFMATRNKLDEFLSVVIIIFVINSLTMLFTKYIAGDTIFSFVWMNLVNIGVVIQILTEAYTTNKLIWINVLAYGIGFVLIIIMWQIDQEYNLRKFRLFMLMTMIFIFIVLIFAGKIISRTSAWIMIGSNSIQLTEILKLLGIIYISSLLADKKMPDKSKMTWLIVFLLINTAGYLIIEEIGTLALTYIVAIFLSFIFIQKIEYFLAMLGVIIAILGFGILVLYIGHELSGVLSWKITDILNNLYLKQVHRLDLWINIENLNDDAAYQIVTAQKATTVGGLLGNTKAYYVPAQTTDFVFVSLLSKMGYIFGILTLVLFFAFMMRGASIAKKKSGIRQIFTAAFTLSIFVQALIMILGSTNAFLLTGIGVPFLGGGGSNYVVTTTMTLFILINSGNKVNIPNFIDILIMRKIRRGRKKCLKESEIKSEDYYIPKAMGEIEEELEKELKQ